MAFTVVGYGKLALVSASTVRAAVYEKGGGAAVSAASTAGVAELVTGTGLYVCVRSITSGDRREMWMLFDDALGNFSEPFLCGESETISRIDVATKTVRQGTTSNVGATTTNVPIGSINVALTGTNQLVGQVIKFALDTTTAALQGAASAITANTTTAITVSPALPAAPGDGDVFVVQ